MRVLRSQLVRAIDRFWMTPAPAERLAVVRVVVALYSVGFLIARAAHLLSYTDLDPTDFEPIGVVTIVARPLPSLAVYLIYVATLALNGCFLLGWRHRVTGPLFAAALLWVLTYAYSWGKINHTENLLVLQVMVLGLTRSADAVSLDVRRSNLASAARYGWPLRLMCTLCVATYVLAGVAKLRSGGLDFVLGDTLRNHVAFDNVRKLELGSVHSPIGAALVSWPGFFAALAWLSLALELGAPLALIHRRLATVWCIAVWSFHVGVLALMAIVFPHQLAFVAYAPFFCTEKLLARWPLTRFENTLTRRG